MFYFSLVTWWVLGLQHSLKIAQVSIPDYACFWKLKIMKIIDVNLSVRSCRSPIEHKLLEYIGKDAKTQHSNAYTTWRHLHFLNPFNTWPHFMQAQLSRNESKRDPTSRGMPKKIVKCVVHHEIFAHLKFLILFNVFLHYHIRIRSQKSSNEKIDVPIIICLASMALSHEPQSIDFIHGFFQVIIIHLNLQI